MENGYFWRKISKIYLAYVNFFPYFGRNYPFCSSHSFYLSNTNELINDGYERKRDMNKNYKDT